MYVIEFLFCTENSDDCIVGGEPIHCIDSQEAVIKGMLHLKMTVPDADFIYMCKKENSTHIYFIDDSSVKIKITPNVLTKGVMEVPARSLSTGVLVSDMPEL